MMIKADRSVSKERADLLAGRGDLAAAVKRLQVEPAVSLPLLNETQCQNLVLACESLNYRPAKPIVGGPGRQVEQDFVLTMEIPALHPLRNFTATFEERMNRGLELLDPPAWPGFLPFDDLIVQRYEPGSRGITPHRDHIRYRGLVAIVTLVGEAAFFVCQDRSGAGAMEIPMPPGSLSLMRAPGLYGSEERPFHFLHEVTSTRVSIGLRHDTQKKAQPG